MSKKELKIASFIGYSYDASYYINNDDTGYYGLGLEVDKDNADYVLSLLRRTYGDSLAIIDCTEETFFDLPDYGKQEKGDCVTYVFTYDASYPIYANASGVSYFTDSVRLEKRRNYLPWQEKGLSYTASGYGRKIPSTLQVKFGGRWRRVYHNVCSNTGTTYVIVNGREVVLHDYHLNR